MKYGYNPILAGAPMYVAQDRGYFAEHGFDVEFVPFDSGALMIAPASAGQLDVIPAVPSPGLFNALARDITLKLVAAMSWSETTLSVRKDLVESGQVRTLQDLRGRRVSFNVEGSPVDFALRNMFVQAGLTLQDVEVQRLSNTDTGPALANGALDAGVASDPIPLLLEQRGIAVRFAYSRDVLPRQIGSALAMGPSMLGRGDEVNTRFLVAYLRGFRDWVAAVHDRQVSDPALLARLSDWTHVPAETIAQTTIPEGDPGARVDLDNLKRAQQFWVEQGLLASPIDMERFVEYKYLDAALARLD